MDVSRETSKPLPAGDWACPAYLVQTAEMTDVEGRADGVPRAVADTPASCHRRPDELDDRTVRAVGKVTEALETVERARGCLYEFHQLIGSGAEKLSEAVGELRRAGQVETADRLEAVLVGRNVLPGRWTFQVVEEFDDGYWSCFREQEQQVRQDLCAGRRHLYEAEMKERERTHDGGDVPPQGHAATPESGS